MIGLADCNNFYASCERVFNPNLRNRAVVVLSNNDGCVIARSPEAKNIGVQMGTPAFRIKNLIDSGDVVAMSSNYTLYGDMSRRVMNILSEFAPDIEIYSIDEAFFAVPDNINYKSFGDKIARTITQCTGIPLSIGIAPTKTLAKVANHAAKKYPGYNRVCVIATDAQRVRALRITPIDEVWGIGRRYAARLRDMGVNTAYDFANMERATVRKMMTILGEKTWRELNGMPCIDIETVAPDKHQISTSRSFGEMVHTLDELEPAIATFASRGAAKLRAQKLCAGTVMPFIVTNRFRDDLPQLVASKIVALPQYSDDTRVIVRAALNGLREIYRNGFLYKRAGVILSELTPRTARQLDLFTKTYSDEKLMPAIDKLNKKFGRDTLRTAAEITDNKWRMRRENLSPEFTTDINQIITIVCE